MYFKKLIYCRLMNRSEVKLSKHLYPCQRILANPWIKESQGCFQLYISLRGASCNCKSGWSSSVSGCPSAMDFFPCWQQQHQANTQCCSCQSDPACLLLGWWEQFCCRKRSKLWQAGGSCIYCCRFVFVPHHLWRTSQRSWIWSNSCQSKYLKNPNLLIWMLF